MKTKNYFVLIYDIPLSHHFLKLRVNRALRKIKALQIQKSVWKHEDLEKMIEIAMMIKNLGGKASILEEKFLF